MYIVRRAVLAKYLICCQLHSDEIESIVNPSKISRIRLSSRASLSLLSCNGLSPLQNQGVRGKGGGITDQRYPSSSFVIRNPATYIHRLNSSATCRHLLLSLISLHHRPTFRSFDVDTFLPRTK